MLPRETLATAQIPGGDTLTLISHGRDFVIMLGRDELMGTRMQFSEEQLAELTLAELARPAPRVLIGGYGMGFTFRAALAHAGEGASVTVAGPDGAESATRELPGVRPGHWSRIACGSSSASIRTRRARS